MTDKHYSWESVYEDLLTGDYKEILDQETESGRYYEIYWMIKHFKEAGEIEKTNFLIELEEKIESIEGRKLDIGDRFIIDDENVKCIVEITDFDENNSAFIEFSDIEYKTPKREITQNFDVNSLERAY